MGPLEAASAASRWIARRSSRAKPENLRFAIQNVLQSSSIVTPGQRVPNCRLTIRSPGTREHGRKRRHTLECQLLLATEGSLSPPRGDLLRTSVGTSTPTTDPRAFTPPPDTPSFRLPSASRPAPSPSAPVASRPGLGEGAGGFGRGCPSICLRRTARRASPASRRQWHPGRGSPAIHGRTARDM